MLVGGGDSCNDNDNDRESGNVAYLTPSYLVFIVRYVYAAFHRRGFVVVVVVVVVIGCSTVVLVCNDKR